jgi:hypothetical protein
VGCKVKVERNVEGRTMESGPSVRQREGFEHLHPVGLTSLFALERTFKNRIFIMPGEQY